MYYLDPQRFEFSIGLQSVHLYHLHNDHLDVWITNYGGRVVAQRACDRNGSLVDVVLGFDSIQKYFDASEQYHGAIIGRYGNRIHKGHLELEGKTYHLPINNGNNCLHGGIKGFNFKVWTVTNQSEKELTLTYLSKDGEEGFPGNLSITCKYTLVDNALKIEFFAKTDQITSVNLTHHNYFNLMGEGSGSIYDQELKIHATTFTPLTADCVPTGEIRSVNKSPFDFTEWKKIGHDIDAHDDQIGVGSGYDHNFVLDGYKDKDHTFLAAQAKAPNGILMNIYTNEPGIQLYSANWLSGKDVGKNGIPHRKREAFCLEQQHFPNAPNEPSFQTTILRPDEEYYSICIQEFCIWN
jgi:aldose 1-epimerase